MSGRDCVGEGAGWGTIEGKSLRVLLLADARRGVEARAIARALSTRHTVELSTEAGFFRALHAAKRAHGLRPHLIHAVGVEGGASPAWTVARGLDVPVVMSLTADDLEVEPRGGAQIARDTSRRLAESSAVLVDEGRLTDVLRAAGILRDLYVLAPPDAPEHDALFLGAVEVIYGRVIAGVGVDLEDAHDLHEAPGPELVQIGRLERKTPA